MNTFLGMPVGASEYAQEIDLTNKLVHYLMFAMLIIWAIYFFYFLIRYRARPGHSASYKSFPSNWIPVSLVAVVGLFDTYMLTAHDIPFWHELKTNFPSEQESTVVRVVGQQFAWNVHYPGADGVFGRTAPQLVDEQANPIGLDHKDPAAQDDITTVGDLHLPVHKAVIIHLTTKDVIHSFTLQELRVKQDVIPGMSTPIHFVPTLTSAEFLERIEGSQREGRGYEITCSQLCGNSHFRMRGFLTVETQAEFDAWLAEKAAELGAGEEEVW